VIHAQARSQISNGFVGIYADPLGTLPCATVPPYTSTTLYVIGNLAGNSAAGITGVEFRVEVTNPSGWIISYNAPPAANVSIGSPIDTGSGAGANLAFPSCQQGTNGKVPLGTILVFNQTGNPSQLLVKRHSTPANQAFQCPLFALCDFSLTCMSPSSAPPCSLSTAKATTASVAEDPVVFTATLNSAQSPSEDPPSPQPFSGEDGRLGIFFDTAGQSCSAVVDPGSVITMYVVAQLAGQTANGIKGAEFRIDGIPAAWSASASAPMDAVVIGDVLGAGATIGLASCEQGVGGFVTLSTVSLTATSTVSDVLITVRKKEPPSNSTKRHPLLLLCDGQVTWTRGLRGKAFINPSSNSDCTDYRPPRAPARPAGIGQP
jgi:hypothetical protein